MKKTVENEELGVSSAAAGGGEGKDAILISANTWHCLAH